MKILLCCSNTSDCLLFLSTRHTNGCPAEGSYVPTQTKQDKTKSVWVTGQTAVDVIQTTD